MAIPVDEETMMVLNNIRAEASKLKGRNAKWNEVMHIIVLDVLSKHKEETMQACQEKFTNHEVRQ